MYKRLRRNVVMKIAVSTIVKQSINGTVARLLTVVLLKKNVRRGRKNTQIFA